MLRALLFMAISTCINLEIHAAENPSQGEANVMIELSFTASNTHDDPFNTVSLDVVFTTPNNKTLRVPAFWAGGDKWKVRYAAPIVGTHHFISECSDAQDKGLHHVAGSVRINAYKGDNPFYKHGPIQIAADH